MTYHPDASDYAAHRVPPLRAPRGFWVALVLGFAVLFGAGERWARELGVAPMVNDTPSSWSLMRSAVGPRDVVVVGTSRAQRGIDPAVLAEYTGGTPVVQLARSSSGALPILEELAADESFVGTVIVDILPNHWRLLPDAVDGNLNARALLEAHGNRAVSLPIEDALRRFFARRLAVASPDFSVAGIARALAGVPPIPGQNPLRFTERRFVELDARWFDAETALRRQQRANRNLAESAVADPEVVRAAAAPLREATERLRARGARVAFVTLPVTGLVLEREAHQVPRALVFDTLAAEVGGEWLHWQDAVAAGLLDDALVCPDGSHLDTDSAHRVTRWLGRALFAAP
jgi:hypothetical protein